ncbi:MAG: M23 family metallopeptidase [Caulobacteraceae bacterium]|nr:M23 family metallopeptidase [Caulobacter sp.]
MRRRLFAPLLALPLLLAAAPAPPPAGAPVLDFPLACELGRTCFVQRYLDRDPGPGARDYTCGTDTQDGHNGTDIRLRDFADMRRGVAVLAMASGRVARTRDGEPDVSVRERGLQNLDGRNCGNAVVIDHGNGWESQYCHMARGSVAVKPGEVVRAGQPIGRVGLSGETEFPHLHIGLSHAGAAVDPFAPGPGGTPPGACGSGASLWRHTPPYLTRVVINTGFADRAVDMPAIEAGDIAPPTPAAPILAAYARLIDLKRGDRLSLTLMAPGGQVLAPAAEPPLAHDEQIAYLLAGKRRPPSGWPRGVYRAVLKVEPANGAPPTTRAWEVTL